MWREGYKIVIRRLVFLITDHAAAWPATTATRKKLGSGLSSVLVSLYQYFTF